MYHTSICTSYIYLSCYLPIWQFPAPPLCFAPLVGRQSGASKDPAATLPQGGRTHHVWNILILFIIFASCSHVRYLTNPKLELWCLKVKLHLTWYQTDMNQTYHIHSYPMSRVWPQLVPRMQVVERGRHPRNVPRALEAWAFSALTFDAQKTVTGDIWWHLFPHVSSIYTTLW